MKKGEERTHVQLHNKSYSRVDIWVCVDIFYGLVWFGFMAYQPLEVI